MTVGHVSLPCPKDREQDRWLFTNRRPRSQNAGAQKSHVEPLHSPNGDTERGTKSHCLMQSLVVRQGRERWARSRAYMLSETQRVPRGGLQRVLVPVGAPSPAPALGSALWRTMKRFPYRRRWQTPVSTGATVFAGRAAGPGGVGQKWESPHRCAVSTEAVGCVSESGGPAAALRRHLLGGVSPPGFTRHRL